MDFAAGAKALKSGHSVAVSPQMASRFHEYLKRLGVRVSVRDEKWYALFSSKASETDAPMLTAA
ncbi:hypothetical protein [Thermosulfurimonas sp. F29]|uniref:hypothetical protein n=1 Tax=Thermosulfurimonas sp. F29 TaxID=2867247 RepID=UPI001C83AA32|nr:hypothetical protein [Thermosulfurimonas sp. F29]MBX6424098.1 hypothetical protein [Thermosulfurimonas sp. F29]